MTAPEGWVEQDGALVREIRLAGFRDAIALVNRIAELAEAENHHPELEIHYDRVVVRWWTHTAGGVTERDRALAAATNGLI